jgi:spermidine dehydrogenase
MGNETDRSRCDRAPGMDRPIARRDFLNGVAVGVGGLMAAGLPGRAAVAAPQDVPGYYPPILAGLRGSHPGSFEAAHALRDGTAPAAPRETGERYDLVIVGGGISGLAAAHFYRTEINKAARILIIDNHDDFGGHAKRNEFRPGDRLALMNGGTLEIDSPRPYSKVSAGLLKHLGIAPTALEKRCAHDEVYEKRGMGVGVFFDAETFGADKLAVGWGKRPWAEILADTPLSPTARADVERVEKAEIDFMPGLTSAQKKDRLSRMSYREYLGQVVKIDPQALAFYQTRSQGWWGVGIDAVSALDVWAMDFPGFKGLKLAPGSIPRMGPTPAGYADTGGSEKFHFPDGNASIARLLVRDLIPEAVPGSSVEDVVTAKVDYGRLDRDGAPVRLRLSSIALKVANQKDGVEIVYVRGGETLRVEARHCVLASWNMMIPYLCPELPEKQKAALHDLVKAPLVYTSVQIANWQSFARLGVRMVMAPGGYHTYLRLNECVDIGDYTSPRSPDQPALVHMVRTPCQPGLSEHDQNRAGRAELLATDFDTFEREIRGQLQRILGPGGFDAARDIQAITVNRWPHGYAPEYNPLWDTELPEAQRPHVLGRARFGRIAIANSDSGGVAYTDSAIDQAHRAIRDLANV